MIEAGRWDFVELTFRFLWRPVLRTAKSSLGDRRDYRRRGVGDVYCASDAGRWFDARQCGQSGAR